MKFPEHTTLPDPALHMLFPLPRRPLAALSLHPSHTPHPHKFFSCYLCVVQVFFSAFILLYYVLHYTVPFSRKDLKNSLKKYIQHTHTHKLKISLRHKDKGKMKVGKISFSLRSSHSFPSFVSFKSVFKSHLIENFPGQVCLAVAVFSAPVTSTYLNEYLIQCIL